MKNIEYINAGAGSGKTFTLTRLLCEYLDGTKGSYMPSQVILTTFTELAAAEFREKARGALLEKGMPEQASQLETASIGTVHSVVLSFVKKFWYLLGRGAVQNVMSDRDRQFYINQSMGSLTDKNIIAFFERVHKQFGFASWTGKGNNEDSDFWKDHLKEIIEKMVNYEIHDLKLSLEKSQNLIHDIFSGDVEVDEAQVRDVFERYVEICNCKERKKRVEKALRAQSLTFSSLVELNNLKPISAEIEQIPELKNIQLSIEGALRSKKYGSVLKDYVKRIFELAGEWKGEFDAYKAKNRLIDYNGMEKLFLDLLEEDEVKQEITSRYKLVLVDEFQDSSPIQVKIFSKLSGLVAKSIWVGDPKQAIYGFRGSDALLVNAVASVFTHEGGRRGLIKGASLSKSYRSRKGLVELSNAVFTRAFSKIDEKDVALEVHRDDRQEFGENTPRAVIHWHTESGNQKHKARDLAQKVFELLQSQTRVIDKKEKKPRRIRPEDMAILCRKNTDVNEIAQALQGYGIKTTGQKADDTFVEAAEVKLFLAILNFLQNPSNDLAKAEILHLSAPEDQSVENIISSRMEYLGDRQNHAGKCPPGEKPGTNPGWQEDHPLIRQIRGLSEELKALPVPDLVERLMTELDMKSMVAALGSHERRQKSLDALVTHAMDFDQQCLQMGLGASLNNFIVYLNSLEYQEQKPEKVEGSVNVLTYHSAKGLEWNVVILDSLYNDLLETNDVMKKSFFGVNAINTEAPTPENLFPPRYIQLMPWFMGTKKHLPRNISCLIQEKDAYNIILDKDREGARRLLYVGVTRARDYLVTVSYGNNSLKWIQNIGGREISPGKCTHNSIDVWDVGMQSELEVITGDEEFAGNYHPEQPRRLMRPSRNLCFKDRYISPGKAHVDGAFHTEVLKDFGKRIPTKMDMETDDAEMGNCLHYIYYSWSQKDENSLAKAMGILENLKMSSVFPCPQEIVDSIERLYEFLEERYGPAVSIYKELPLQTFTDEEHVVRGSIDLVWETKMGAVVVDYKSYQGGINNITDPKHDHYAGIYGAQLLTYQRMLKTAGKTVLATCIYYAVMGVVVDVGAKRL